MDQPLGIIGLFSYVLTHWQDLLQQWYVLVQAFVTLVGVLVTLASIITPFTSTPKDDAFLAKVKNWIHQFAVTNAKNVRGVGQDDTVTPPK